jgi:UDP-glucose-4-epimerase GalE
MKVLITGGAGFIGSTIASRLIELDMVPVVLDNLVTGRESFADGRHFYQGDMADGDLVDRIFREHPDITAVVHCAALIRVPESTTEPLRYYRVNVAATISLLEHLVRVGCDRIVMASTAGMYLPSEDLSVDEHSPFDPQNPYTRSKMMVELLLADCAAAYGLRVISLRYLNPIGADPKMRTGLQTSKPTHALGKMIESYLAERPFQVTGVDWPTRDGTAIRDYIHVWDVACAFAQALERFDQVLPPGAGGYEAINLGTGSGTTVRELVDAFEAVVGSGFEWQEAAARPGDVIGMYTTGDKATAMLGWKPQYSIEDSIRHSLEWAERSSAPHGHLESARQA